MEQYHITFLHFESYAVVGRGFFVVVNAEVGLIDHSFPLGVNVLEEFSLVAAWEYFETPIISGNVLECGPSSHNFIGRSKWEISEILMKGMP